MLNQFTGPKCTDKQQLRGNPETVPVPAKKDVEGKRNSICLAHQHFNAEKGKKEHLSLYDINIVQTEKNCGQEQLMLSYFTLFSSGD